MAYTTINKSSLHQNTVLYTGNGSSQNITGVGFQPDLNWLKSRSDSSDYNIVDAIRGSSKYLRSNENNAEATSATGISGFLADGFSVGSDQTTNKNSSNFVAWNWKANGTGSANADGSITTTSTSVNTTAKFSISKWTGNGTGGSSIGHGLGVKPEFVIIKRLEGAQSWYVWHKDLGDNYLELDTTTSTASGGLTVSTSTITFPNSWSIYNESGEAMICYAWASVAGYSKFGLYKSNDQDFPNSPFIYTGFKPQILIIKQSNATRNWQIVDNKRDTYNPADARLYIDHPSSEDNGSSYETANFLSNGFKLDNSDGAVNVGSGNDYIYMAWGQTMVGTNNVPATGG